MRDVIVKYELTFKGSVTISVRADNILAADLKLEEMLDNDRIDIDSGNVESWEIESYDYE